MAVIFHIDLNSFFASAEVSNNSALAHLPVVVANHSRRSVICTASYEARELGISAAMPLEHALSIAPNLVVCQVNFDLYNKLSKQFVHLLKQYTSKVEPASIDECYMDVTDIIKHYSRPLDLAWEIQQRVQQELKIGCSIGIAPTKFLAKIASDLKKPMGITVIRKSELSAKIYPLSIDHIQGVGKKSKPLLLANSIVTIEDFANPENEQLICSLLGKNALQLIKSVRGESSSNLNYNHSIQSISQSTTFEYDSIVMDEILEILKRLSTELSARAKKQDVSGCLLNVSIRYHNFKTIVRSMTLERHIDNSEEIFELASLLFKRNWDGETALRHVGVGLGSLQSNTKKIEQIELFSHKKIEKLDILQELNKQLSSGHLQYASSIVKKNED